MNVQQIIGPFRPLLVWLIATFAYKVVPSDQVGPIADQVIQVVSAVVLLGTMIWSFFDHSTTKQIDRVAKMREVKAIETTEAEFANKGLLANNDKVVPASRF